MVACRQRNSLYIGLCISTTSHGVIVRLTDLRSLSSHSYWSEPDVRLCSELSMIVWTMDWSYEYLCLVAKRDRTRETKFFSDECEDL